MHGFSCLATVSCLRRTDDRNSQVIAIMVGVFWARGTHRPWREPRNSLYRAQNLIPNPATTVNLNRFTINLNSMNSDSPWIRPPTGLAQRAAFKQGKPRPRPHPTQPVSESGSGSHSLRFAQWFIHSAPRKSSSKTAGPVVRHPGVNSTTGTVRSCPGPPDDWLNGSDPPFIPPSADTPSTFIKKRRKLIW